MASLLTNNTESSVNQVIKKKEFATVNHTYTFFNPKTQVDRTLSFCGIDMKGLVDLTLYEKATGEAIWPCCTLLADYLSQHYDVKIHGNKVLELGCGLGLLGAICAAKIGSSNVRNDYNKNSSITLHRNINKNKYVITENDDDVLLVNASSSTSILENNNNNNNNENNQQVASNDSPIVVLTDGNKDVLKRCIACAKENFLLTDCRNVFHQILWWGDEFEMLKLLNQTPHGHGFSLILASDVVYERDGAETKCKLLAKTVDYLLDKTNLNAQFLVSFQLRSVDVNILYKAFEDIGFKHYIPTTCDCSDIESDDEILCFEDVYGERHDEMTMLTDKFVIAFVRKQEE